MKINDPLAQQLPPLDPETLSNWLGVVQSYATSPEALHRIGASVAAFTKMEQTPDKDTLFWTEPANMDSLLNKVAPATTSPGPEDE